MERGQRVQRIQQLQLEGQWQQQLWGNSSSWRGSSTGAGAQPEMEAELSFIAAMSTFELSHLPEQAELQVPAGMRQRGWGISPDKHGCQRTYPYLLHHQEIITLLCPHLVGGV